MRDRPNDEAMAEKFRNDPTYAVEFLDSILEDGDQDDLRIALRQMTAKQVGPEIFNVSAALRSIGLRLVVKPLR